jgi:hypothetical protein
MSTDPLDSANDRPGTKAVHGDHDARGGSLVPPIVQATTFAASTSEQFLDAASRTFSDDFYTRYGNPNHSQVAEVVAVLEGAERAIVTASGMGAISTLALSLLEPGDHIAVQRTIYPGTTGLVTGLLGRFGVTSSVIEQRDPESLNDALTDRTRLVLLETPSNPLLAITDLRRCSELAHARGALVVVDNTVATPINQLPISAVTLTSQRALSPVERISLKRFGAPISPSARYWGRSTRGCCCEAYEPSMFASHAITRMPWRSRPRSRRTPKSSRFTTPVWPTTHSTILLVLR